MILTSSLNPEKRRMADLALMGAAFIVGVCLWLLYLTDYGVSLGIQPFDGIYATLIIVVEILLFAVADFFWGGKTRGRHEFAGAMTMAVSLLLAAVLIGLYLTGLYLWIGEHVWTWTRFPYFRGVYAVLAVVAGAFLFGLVDYVWGIRTRSSKVASVPMMIIVLVVFIGGTIWTVMSSFTDIRTLPIFTPQEFYDHWVGLAQYQRLWRTTKWLIAIKNLALYGFFNTVLAFIIGFMLAVFMDQKIRLEGVFRTIYLYPFALSFIVTGHVWAWILNPAFGLEGTIRKLGWESFSFSWLSDRDMAIYCVVIAGLWQGTGLVMALMLAGLRGIDDEIWRAARVDGIPKWRTYLQIVIPMMRPVLVTTFVIVASGSVRVFDLVLALTQGGPGLSSVVPSMYIYEGLFVGALAQGTAASSTLLLATAIILIPWIIVEFGKKKEGH